MKNLLDAALVEARKSVHVGSYTRTSKSGKISRVGSYDQWRVLAGASLKGVARGSKVKINVGGRTHEGVVTRRKGTDVTVKTKSGLSVPVVGKEVTHVAEPAVAGAAPKSGPKKPAKPKLTHEQKVILDGQKGGLTKRQAQAEAKASNAAAKARDAGWESVDDVEARLAARRAARKKPKAEVAPKPSRQQRTKPSPPVKPAPTHDANAPDLPTFAQRGDLVQQLAVATHTGDGIPVRRTDQKLVGGAGSPRNVSRMSDEKLAHELSAVLNGAVIPPNGVIENSTNGMTLHAGIARFVEEMGKRVGGRWKDPYTGVSYQLDAVLAQLQDSKPRVKRVKSGSIRVVKDGRRLAAKQRTVPAPPMTDKNKIVGRLTAPARGSTVSDMQAALDSMVRRAPGGEDHYVRTTPLTKMTHAEVKALSQDAKKLLVQRLMNEMLTKNPSQKTTDRIVSWLKEGDFTESNPYDVRDRKSVV